MRIGSRLALVLAVLAAAMVLGCKGSEPTTDKGAAPAPNESVTPKDGGAPAPADNPPLKVDAGDSSVEKDPAKPETPVAKPDASATATEKPAPPTAEKPKITVKLPAAEAKLVGNYKGDIKVPAPQKGDAYGEMAAQMAKAMKSTLALELKADKTFNMVMFVPVEGSWTLAGGKVTLKIEKIMGRTMAEVKAEAAKRPNMVFQDPSQKPLKFAVSPDGNTLTSVEEKTVMGSKDGQMTFTRKKS
jgi:roadblock/LC7 domain-containing protein